MDRDLIRQNVKNHRQMREMSPNSPVYASADKLSVECPICEYHRHDFPISDCQISMFATASCPCGARLTPMVNNPFKISVSIDGVVT